MVYMECMKRDTRNMNHSIINRTPQNGRKTHFDKGLKFITHLSAGAHKK